MKKMSAFLTFIVSLVILGGLIGFIYVQKNQPAPLVLEVTSANFDKEVLSYPNPIYVGFYMPGEKYSEMQRPVVDKLAAEYAGKVKFVRIDVSKNMDLARSAGITGVPSHFLIKPAIGVGVVGEGYLDETQLRELVEKGLKAQPPAPQPGPNPAPQPDPNVTPQPESNPAK